LAYASQRECEDDRLSRKAQKIYDRMFEDWCILVGPPPKPKGMHWKTYNRLAPKADNAARQSIYMAASRIGFDPGDFIHDS
jgi:hypothetical protein